MNEPTSNNAEIIVSSPPPPYINAMEVPKNTGIIHMQDKYLQYRADCQAGQFKIGANQMVGKSMNMEVLKWRKFSCEQFNYEYQDWIEIVFINPENIVSHILFKTESLDNFVNLNLLLLSKMKAFGLGITTATMSKRASQSGNSYFAIEFEWNPQKEERIKELSKFTRRLPS